MKRLELVHSKKLFKCIQWSHLMHSESESIYLHTRNLFIGAEKRQALDDDFVVHFVAWFIAQLHHFHECLYWKLCRAKMFVDASIEREKTIWTCAAAFWLS